GPTEMSRCAVRNEIAPGLTEPPVGISGGAISLSTISRGPPPPSMLVAAGIGGFTGKTLNNHNDRKMKPSGGTGIRSITAAVALGSLAFRPLRIDQAFVTTVIVALSMDGWTNYLPCSGLQPSRLTDRTGQIARPDLEQ